MAADNRYGFNLGQIEGLDSSVKTVTLTIANATESNTYTLTYISGDGDEGWTDNGSFVGWAIALHEIDDDIFVLDIANFTESDVGDTYNVTLSTSVVEENLKSAVETVLVDNGLIGEPETLFDGTITITAEDTRGVEIPFDMDVSNYPFEKWTVTVNDEPLIYSNGFFARETETYVYVVGDRDGVYMFLARNDDGIIPGDYQVKITGIAGKGGIPEPGTTGTILYSRHQKWVSGLPIDENADAGYYAIQMRLGETEPEFAGWKKIPGVVTSAATHGIYIVVGGDSGSIQVININPSSSSAPAIAGNFLLHMQNGAETLQLIETKVPNRVPTTPGKYVLQVKESGDPQWVLDT